MVTKVVGIEIADMKKSPEAPIEFRCAAHRDWFAWEVKPNPLGGGPMWRDPENEPVTDSRWETRHLVRQAFPHGGALRTPRTFFTGQVPVHSFVGFAKIPVTTIRNLAGRWEGLGGGPCQ